LERQRSTPFLKMNRSNAMRTRIVLSLLLPILLLATTAGSASTAHLVADLRPGVQELDPLSATSFQSYTPVNGRVVFLSFAPADTIQCNLWATDGTAGGTERLADLCGELHDFSGTSGPRILATNGETAFFTDPLGRLWRTDGTAAGTFPLRPVQALGGIIGPDGHTFFFAGCTPAEGCEPWVSDGTPAGTRMVRSLDPGAASSNPTAFTIQGGRVLFGATRGLGYGLWTTDGTAAGTFRLASTRRPVQTIVPVGRQIYFGAWDSSRAEAWVLPERFGTASKIREFFTDFRASGLHILTAGGRVFFTVVEPDGRGSVFLWATDGTTRGTRLLGEFSIFTQIFELGRRIVFASARVTAGGGQTLELWSLEPGMSSPRRLQGCPRGGCPRLNGAPIVQLGSRILFSGWDAARGHELWTSDGTAEGTRLLKNLCPGPCDGGPGRFRVVQDRVVFSTTTGELWETDGTTAGTLRLAGRQPEDPSSAFGPPLDLAELDGRIVFTGFDPVNGLQPWVSDLTPAGTRPIDVLGLTLGASSQIGSIVPFGGKVLFAGCDDVGFRAFVSDGTAAGTVLLPVPALRCEPFQFLFGQAVGDLAFFAWDRRLWRTDGTPAGTFALGPSGFQFPRGMAELGGRLLFGFDPPVFGPTENGWLWDYWTSDGTPAGTRLAFQVRLGGTPTRFIVAGDQAFFRAQHPVSPFPDVLWRTDGTEAGTWSLPVNIRINDPGLHPELVSLNDRIWLVAASAERPFGSELWETDGTPQGTIPVFPDGNGPHDLQSLTVFQGSLYFFAALPGSAQTGLWSSDGTAEGTVLLKAITLQQTGYGPLPPLLTAAGDALFFRADDGVHGGELWATDGTAEGTRLVRDIAPGKSHSRVASLTAVGDRLFFIATDGEHGLELWESDGTAAGTRLVEDIFSGPTSAFPLLLTPAEGSLFFTANDGPHGRELWEAQ
jgi:ELWxxDGT repeat protein